jgi:GEVED domain/Secretion system C-terminal sorting domain
MHTIFTFRQIILCCLFFYFCLPSSTIQAQACTGSPNPGNTLASTTAPCPTTIVTFSMQNASTLGTGVTFQWYHSIGLIAGATNSTYSSVVTMTDTFWCSVTCTASSMTTNSTPLPISSNFIFCYCASNATSTQDEDIYNVTLNGSSTNPLYANANGCTTAAPGPGSILSKYSSFLSLPPLTNLYSGGTFPFSVYQDECDGPAYFLNYIGIWIDFNHNASFSDPGEHVYTENNPTMGPRTVTGLFTIPFSAMSGQTVMRVICSETTIPNSCGTYPYGETEDYLIGIVENPTSSASLISETYPYVYPNPTSGIFDLVLNNKSDILMINSLGEIILQRKFEQGNQKLDISSYANGLYFLKVMDAGKVFTLKISKQ